MSGAAAASKARPLNDLGIRAISGFALIAIAVGSTLVGGATFVVAWLAASGATHWEWQRLVGGGRLLARTIYGAVLLCILAWAASRSVFAATACIVALAGGVALLQTSRRLWGFAGAFYVGLFVFSLILLRFSAPFGSRALVWLFAVVWSTDVFAYFGGRLIGGPKLWPRVSPSKTWSGTLTGAVAAAGIGTFTALRDLHTPSALVPVLVLSLVTSIVAQAGDAGESAMKRHFGVKDSSRLIPGHGGILDRLDGFIAATIFAALFGALRHLPSVASGLFSWN